MKERKKKERKKEKNSKHTQMCMDCDTACQRMERDFLLIAADPTSNDIFQSTFQS